MRPDQIGACRVVVCDLIRSDPNFARYAEDDVCEIHLGEPIALLTSVIFEQ